MAISSNGGAEVTETPGNVSAEGVQTPGAEGTAAPAAVGQPYATINGVDYATPEDLTKAWDAGTVQKGAGASTEGGTETAAAGADTLKGGQGNDSITAPERTDEQIIASLKEAGGIFADERYAPFALEFEKSGGKGLTPESLTKAAAAFNVPEAAVKTFMDGQIAQRQLQAATAGQPTAAQVATAQAIVEVVPGEADYKALLAWGKDNLSPEDRTAYDSALDRGDKATVKALLTSFQGRFSASGDGKGPRDVTQEGAGAGTTHAAGAEPYESSAQMQADMGKPEYRADPAFRAKVERRVAASKF